MKSKPPCSRPPAPDRPNMSVERRIAMVLMGALALAGPAAADDPPAGREIASRGANGAAACTTCHGAQGEGNPAAGFPRLAGQGADYLAKQLDDMASGVRPSPVMQPIAKSLDEAQRRAVSAFYSSLPPPYSEAEVAASADADVTPAQRGAWLAIRGDWSRNLPACNQCHGPGGIGAGGAIPSLAGQSRDYLARQLEAWRTGQRSPLPLGLMPAVAGRLTPQDMDAVASYYASLPAGPAATSAKTGDRHD